MTETTFTASAMDMTDSLTPDVTVWSVVDECDYIDAFVTESATGELYCQTCHTQWCDHKETVAALAIAA